jgi:hypothetical protein
VKDNKGRNGARVKETINKKWSKSERDNKGRNGTNMKEKMKAEMEQKGKRQ